MGGGRQQVGHRLEWKIFKRMGTGEEWVGQKSKKPPGRPRDPRTNPKGGGPARPPRDKTPRPNEKKKTHKHPPREEILGSVTTSQEGGDDGRGLPSSDP